MRSKANLRGPRACLHLTHTSTHSPMHIPPALTCGICEPHLPSHQLQGQEVMLLIQAPVVEEKSTWLDGCKPGWGGQGTSQAGHLLTPTIPATRSFEGDPPRLG